MGLSSPCKGCKERTLGCHSNCDEYLDYRHKVDAENKEKEKQNFYAKGYRIEKGIKLDKLARNKKR